MPDTQNTQSLPKLPSKPKVWRSHEIHIPEEAEMVTCEDCNGTGLDGEDTLEHRAFSCATCQGHGVVFVLWPETEEPAKKPTAAELAPVQSEVA
jgi:DnaJ-class molecular chaperone